VHAGEEDHINTWTGLLVEELVRVTEINGESMSMVWPTLGSKTAKEQNRLSKSSQATDNLVSQSVPGCIIIAYLSSSSSSSSSSSTSSRDL